MIGTYQHKVIDCQGQRNDIMGSLTSVWAQLAFIKTICILWLMYVERFYDASKTGYKTRIHLVNNNALLYIFPNCWIIQLFIPTTEYCWTADEFWLNTMYSQLHERMVCCTCGTKPFNHCSFLVLSFQMGVIHIPKVSFCEKHFKMQNGCPLFIVFSAHTPILYATRIRCSY